MIFIFLAFQAHAQRYVVKGRVTGASIEPLAFVSVNVEEQINNTITNEKGEFELKLENGKYTLIFMGSGYKFLKKEVIVNKADVFLNIILEEDVQLLNEVDISTKYVDPAKRLIKNVIKNKDKYVQNSYQCMLYIKAVASVNDNLPKQDSITKQGNETDSILISKHKKKTKRLSEKDSLALKKLFVYDKLNMAEVLIKKSYEYPNKLKEERIAITRRGNINSLFYLSSTEGEFNFYQNLVYCPSLSELPFQSPLSTAGLLLYKYKTLKVFTEDGKRIFRIRVEPTLIANALVSGEMEIIDSLYCVRKIDFFFPKYHLNEYSSFEFKADYVPYSDSLYRISKMNFIYKPLGKKNKIPGETSLYVDSFKYETKFSKKYFDDQVSLTLKEAYDKDSTFWQQVRKEPLSKKEIKFIQIDDSVKSAHLAKPYLDSIDKRENRITLPKLLFFGQTHYNRANETRIFFNPLVFVYQPVGIGGARLNYGLFGFKKFKNKKNISLSSNISYGILNGDNTGRIAVNSLYNTFKIARASVELNDNYQIINGNNAWMNVLRTSNFYHTKSINITHSIELVNGLYWSCKLGYSTRSSIASIKNDSLTNLLFNNYMYSAIDFKPYDAFDVVNYISYTFHQKYIRDAYQKIILGSKFPTVKILHRKGVPDFLNSSINYDYVELSAFQEIDFGAFGMSQYNFYTGKFFNAISVKSVDNKYQPLVGFPFFANPLTSFQALEKSYITNNIYYSGHFFHRFNGAIINKIPFVKFLRMSETSGAGFLYSKENNLVYFEVLVGIEKSIRIFDEMFRLGFYFVNAKSNEYPFRSGFRFSIDRYDKQTNKWGF